MSKVSAHCKIPNFKKIPSQPFDPHLYTEKQAIIRKSIQEKPSCKTKSSYK